jgi:hypothetical protein
VKEQILIFELPRTAGDQPIRAFSDFVEAFTWSRNAAKMWNVWLELHRPEAEPTLIGPRL